MSNWQEEWEKFEIDLYESGVKGRLPGEIKQFIADVEKKAEDRVLKQLSPLSREQVKFINKLKTEARR